MPASLSTDRHPARRLAVPSFHPELSRCVGAACQAWARYLIRERSQLGAQIRTDDRSNLRRCVPDRAIASDRWHLDEIVVRIAGKHMYLWRAVDHEGEVLEILVQRRQDNCHIRSAAFCVSPGARVSTIVARR